MKSYKLITAIVFILMLEAGNLSAQQRVEQKSFVLKPDQKIELNLKFGNHINIKAWDKNEVSFKAVIEINNGKLNDALLLDYTDDQQGVRVKADFDKERIKEGRCEDCPQRNYSTYNWNNNGNGYTICSDIVYEVYVPRNANVDVESISADIELAGPEGPVYAKSISGFVDLSWPEQQGANLSMKTISGEAYSNLNNIRFRNKKDHSPIVGYELLGTVGSGGPMLHLESISGNVYLRKEKS